MRRKTQLKRGGGYDSNMVFTSTGPTGSTQISLKDLYDMNEEQDKTISGIFTVTNKDDADAKETYDIIKYIGKGTYGKVYLVKSQTDNNQYVIKIQTNYSSIEKEAKDLDTIMDRVHGKCRYVAISQGKTDRREHAVFPYLGSSDLEKIFINEDITTINMIMMMVPKILTDVIICLDALHSQSYSHLDIKLANIVFNEETNFAHIIDYGLSRNSHDAIRDNAIFNPESINVGGFQLSVEMIIKKFIVPIIKKTQKPDFDLTTNYSQHFDDCSEKLLQTFDNYGLFWLIIGLLTFGKDLVIYNIYIQTATTDTMLRDLFKLYYSLSLEPKPGQETFQRTTAYGGYMTTIISTDFFGLSDHDTERMRNDFILNVRKHINPNAFKLWFDDNESRFTDFIENVILLVHVNPEIRSIPTDILKHHFFTPVASSSSVSSSGGKKSTRKRNVRRRIASRRHRRNAKTFKIKCTAVNIASGNIIRAAAARSAAHHRMH
jgi:serine/threonine protein kinase